MIDPRLLRHYEDELRYLREVAGEFARINPAVAGRLALSDDECKDPYVERLLEGVAFLTARVQLKMEAQFPRFTHHLLDVISPMHMAPVPSMMVASFQPSLGEGSLAEGYCLKAGRTVLRAAADDAGTVQCQYVTAHDVTLYPLTLFQADYLSTAGGVAALGIPGSHLARAAVRLRLRCEGGVRLNQLALDDLPLFLTGTGGVQGALYEQLLGNAIGVLVRPVEKGGKPFPFDAGMLRPCGFAPDQAMLPPPRSGFDGYRLLQEYFALPGRFCFVNLAGIGHALRQMGGTEVEIVILLDRTHPQLDRLVGVGNFLLFCTPAINLFRRSADRIHVRQGAEEFHVVVDRHRPQDFEVHSVLAVRGYDAQSAHVADFQPFFGTHSLRGGRQDRAFYTLARRSSVAAPLRTGDRSRRLDGGHTGTESYIALVDGTAAPFSPDLRQIGVDALCTNRHWPRLLARKGVGQIFALEESAPVEQVRSVEGPSEPLPALSETQSPWRLISHLSLNHLSLTDMPDGEGAGALRELLSLYAQDGKPAQRAIIEAVRSVRVEPAVRRYPGDGPLAWVRGVEIRVEMADQHLDGLGSFLLGAVLDVFLSRYVTANSFTEMVLHSQERGEVMRWPARIGSRSRL